LEHRKWLNLVTDQQWMFGFKQSSKDPEPKEARAAQKRIAWWGFF